MLGQAGIHKKCISENIGDRREAIKLLETNFSSLPYIDQAWQDLHRLTQDKVRDVRAYANHSLGRASVFRATETADKGTLKRELETAVTYFEKSSHEQDFGPAKFCYPFYRAFLAITFQETKEDEVQRYDIKSPPACS